LLEMAKEPSHEYHQLLRLLGQCGAAARPSVPKLLATLDPEDSWTPYTVQCLARTLGPEDRELLPTLRRLVTTKGDTLKMAEVLLRLGLREDAVAQAAHCLKDADPELRVKAARWLGERGREAKAVEPALKQALENATGAERARLSLTLWRLRGA